MQNYIQQYLSDYYYVKTSEVGNDGIYSINEDRRIPTPFNGSKLIKEIVTIFGLQEDDVKPYIETWAVSIKPDIDLEFYWKTMDLVAVQPISGPRVGLLYMDFQYGVDTATGDSETVTATTVVGRQGPTNRNGRVYDEEIYRQSWGDIVQLYENQQNHIVGELDHPSDSVMERALQKWSSLIGISSRKFGE